MKVSKEEVKLFLLDLINQSNFPGNILDFVSEVKKEISDATIEIPVKDATNHPHKPKGK